MRQSGDTEGLSPGHRVMDRFLGNWTATVTLGGESEPGAESLTVRGYETGRLGPGGRWMFQDLFYKLLTNAYESHAVVGYDPVTDRYTAVWVDSTEDRISQVEGVWDPQAQSLTFVRKSRGPNGEEVVEEVVDRFTSPQRREFTVKSSVEGGPATLVTSIVLVHE